MNFKFKKVVWFILKYKLKFKKEVMEHYNVNDFELLKGGMVESEGEIISYICDNYLKEVFNENAIHYIQNYNEQYNDFDLYIIYKKSNKNKKLKE